DPAAEVPVGKGRPEAAAQDFVRVNISGAEVAGKSVALHIRQRLLDALRIESRGPIVAQPSAAQSGDAAVGVDAACRRPRRVVAVDLAVRKIGDAAADAAIF